MEKALTIVPRIAIFLAGVAAGAFTLSRRERTEGVLNPAVTNDLKDSISRVEERIKSQETANADRFEKIETRLEEHAGKLAEVPSTAQIVAAMEQLLSKTMS